MDNSKVLLFRQKNRWGLTALSIVLCLVLLIPALTMAVMSPQIILFIPVLVLALLGFVGPVSAVFFVALFIALSWALLGALGGLCAALFFVPVVAASAVTVERRMPFTMSVGICAGVMFVALELIMAVLSAAAGTDIVSAVSELMRQSFDMLGGMADPLMAAFAQMGIIAAPEGVDLAAVLSGALLDAQTRAQMVNSLIYYIDAGLRYELPAQMVTGSLVCGLLGQAVLRRGVLRRGIEVPYMPLRTWRLPKGWGRVLGVTLAAFYLGAMLLPDRLTSTFYVFGSVFDEIFMLQGIAAVCYMLHRRGLSRAWQGLVFVAGYFLLGTLAIMLGIADQAFDFTHRRAELDQTENPYDPFNFRRRQK